MLYIFSSDSPSIQLSEMINAFCHSYSDFKFVALDNLPSLKQHDKVLFAWEADICGVDTSILKLIHKAYLSSPKFFSGCKGSILCFSKTIFYTKYFWHYPPNTNIHQEESRRRRRKRGRSSSHLENFL